MFKQDTIIQPIFGHVVKPGHSENGEKEIQLKEKET